MSVGEGVKSCPRAGCGKSACPVRWEPVTLKTPQSSPCNKWSWPTRDPRCRNSQGAGGVHTRYHTRADVERGLDRGQNGRTQCNIFALLRSELGQKPKASWALHAYVSYPQVQTLASAMGSNDPTRRTTKLTTTVADPLRHRPATRVIPVGVNRTYQRACSQQLCAKPTHQLSDDLCQLELIVEGGYHRKQIIFSRTRATPCSRRSIP